MLPSMKMSRNCAIAWFTPASARAKFCGVVWKAAWFDVSRRTRTASAAETDSISPTSMRTLIKLKPRCGEILNEGIVRSSVRTKRQEVSRLNGHGSGALECKADWSTD